MSDDLTMRWLRAAQEGYDEYRAKMRKAGLRGWLTYESWLESELRLPETDVPPGPSMPFSTLLDDEDTVEPR